VGGCSWGEEVRGGSEVEVAAARWLEVGASQPLGGKEKAGGREGRLKCEGATKMEAMPSRSP
jgi:hypothetical protein